MPPRRKKTKASSGAPAKGYEWRESTSGKIPNPTVVPVIKKKPTKFKPMRTVGSGVSPAGKATTTVKLRTKKSL